MISIERFFKWMHEKMKTDRYLMNLDFDRQIVSAYKPLESAFAQQQSPKKQRDKDGYSPSHHEHHKHETGATMVDLNFDQGFSGEFPTEFFNLKNEGNSHKKLILVPSIIPTTSELKVDISFEPLNLNFDQPIINRKRQNPKNDLNKIAADQAKTDKYEKLRMLGRPLLPLSLDSIYLNLI
jgi:hypothetical protein